MSPHAIDDDRRGRAQQQGGHDDNGGQDDKDNGPDIQDVFGEHNSHGDLADGVHAASVPDPQSCFQNARPLPQLDRTGSAESSRDRNGSRASPGPQGRPRLGQREAAPSPGLEAQNVPGSSEERAARPGRTAGHSAR